MLDILRKNAGSWWIKTILIAVALSFVIGFGILTQMDESDPSRYVVKVGDTLFSPDEFTEMMMTERNNYYQKYGTEMSDNDILNAQESIIDFRIDQILETSEANRLGLAVSDTEVADMIAQDSLFQKDGEFDYETYNNFLDNYLGYSETRYEAMIKEGLLSQKLKEIVTDSVKITDDDIIETAKTQGRDLATLDELSPDERDFYAGTALAIKRFLAYRKFLDALKTQEEIIINQDYLIGKKE